MSHTILNRHLRNGKFAPEPSGSFDTVKIEEALNLQVHQGNSRRKPAPPTPKPAAVVLPGPDAGSVPEEPGVAEPEEQQAEAGKPPKRGTLAHEQWRLTREKANREVLERKKLEGELVAVAVEAAAWAEACKAIRDGMTAIPDRLAKQLAALTDPRQCRDLLMKEIRKALTGLSDDIRSTTEKAA